jgi:hypothetical protein
MRPRRAVLFRELSEQIRDEPIERWLAVVLRWEQLEPELATAGAEDFRDGE